MSFKDRVNHVRRVMMHKMTENIGQNIWDIRTLGDNASKKKRVLICRPNSRLGNQLLVTPLIQEIEKVFPECRIDLFVRSGVTDVLLQNYASVDRIIKLPKKPFRELIKYLKVWLDLRKYQYDLVINVANNSSSGRLSTKFAKAKVKFFNDTVDDLSVRYEDYFHIAKFPVYNLKYFLSRAGIQPDYADIPVLDLKLSAGEIDKGRQVLYDIVKNEKKTIVIYTFATGDKCYSKDWWEKAYEAMKQKYGTLYNIVEILPVENVSQIGFKALSFYSKDVREIASLIANSVIFVGADCGIMHLAGACGIPVIGLFSVTDMNRYKPYGNRSLAIDTNHATVEDINNEIFRILFPDELVESILHDIVKRKPEHRT